MEIVDKESLEKLRTVFTSKQLEEVADILLLQQERAISRRSQQTLTIVLNERGYPRHFNGSDNYEAEKP